MYVIDKILKEEKLVALEIKTLTMKKSIANQIPRKNTFLPNDHLEIEPIGWIYGEVFRDPEHRDCGLFELRGKLFLVRLSRNEWTENFLTQFYNRDQIFVV